MLNTTGRYAKRFEADPQDSLLINFLTTSQSKIKTAVITTAPPKFR
jgi:hypothetical protein